MAHSVSFYQNRQVPCCLLGYPLLVTSFLHFEKQFLLPTNIRELIRIVPHGRKKQYIFPQNNHSSFLIQETVSPVVKLEPFNKSFLTVCKMEFTVGFKNMIKENYIHVYTFFLQCWRLNLGSHACWASVLAPAQINNCIFWMLTILRNYWSNIRENFLILAFLKTSRVMIKSFRTPSDEHHSEGMFNKVP